MTALVIKRISKVLITSIILFSVLTTLPVPQAAYAEVAAENQSSQVFDITNFPTITIPELQINTDDVKVIDGEVFMDTVKIQNAEKLTHYLQSKNSPMADKSNYLLRQKDWKLIIAISHAESNMCKRQLGNNCWGIGGGDHRKYPNLELAITDAQTVIGKYVTKGADTPEKIVNRYVGKYSANWVKAVNQVLNQLEQLEIEA